eukprot:118251-Rhodomonas_salina.1
MGLYTVPADHRLGIRAAGSRLAVLVVWGANSGDVRKLKASHQAPEMKQRKEECATAGTPINVMRVLSITSIRGDVKRPSKL